MLTKGTVELDEKQAQELGQALARRRIALGYRSARALAMHTGLDYRTITALESGLPRSCDRNSLLTLEIGLDWPAGTITRILSDEDGRTVELHLQIAEDIADDIVEGALKVAQAAFNAYITSTSEVG